MVREQDKGKRKRIPFRVFSDCVALAAVLRVIPSFFLFCGGKTFVSVWFLFLLRLFCGCEGGASERESEVVDVSTRRNSPGRGEGGQV